MRRSGRSDAKARGFTYVECLAALSIIGLALVAADGLFLARPRVEARLQAREEVTRALQLAMETARAGGVTLAAGAHPMLLPTGTAVAARDLAVTLHVRGLRPAGLWEVRAEARYTSGTRVETADLVSLVWRRP